MGTYAYDANGNLQKDGRKGLIFRFNRLNLLGEVHSGDTLKARYTYLSDGTKLGVRDGSGRNGYDYLGSFVYKVSDGRIALDRVLAEGVQLTGSGVRYALTDQLGSVRALVDESGRVVQQTDYYPFGAQVSRPSYAVDNGNRFLFSGKESQALFDLQAYDFGARMYDATLCRWQGVDPMGEKYVNLSPYNYCVNNPLVYVDPNGMDWFRTMRGEIQYYHESYWMDFGSPLHFAFDMNLEWLGLTYETSLASYRMDGSILFKNEADAYAEMYTQTMVTGNESMCLLLTNGKVLVLPSYKNERGEVPYEAYGYKLVNSNIMDNSGKIWYMIGTVHTHTNGSPPSTGYGVLGGGKGDLSFAEKSLWKPMYVFAMNIFDANDKEEVHALYAYPSKDGLKHSTHHITFYNKSFTIDALLQRRISLFDYTKKGLFINHNK